MLNLEKGKDAAGKTESQIKQYVQNTYKTERLIDT